MTEPMIKSHIVGFNVRSMRAKLGLTQAEMAIILGTTQTNLSTIETGKKKLRYKTVTSLAKEFGLSPADLLTPMTSQQEAAQPPEIDPLTAQIIKLVQGFSDTSKHLAIGVLEILGE